MHTQKAHALMYYAWPSVVSGARWHGILAKRPRTGLRLLFSFWGARVWHASPAPPSKHAPACAQLLSYMSKPHKLARVYSIHTSVQPNGQTQAATSWHSNIISMGWNLCEQKKTSWLATKKRQERKKGRQFDQVVTCVEFRFHGDDILLI